MAARCKVQETEQEDALFCICGLSPGSAKGLIMRKKCYEPDCIWMVSLLKKWFLSNLKDTKSVVKVLYS